MFLGVWIDLILLKSITGFERFLTVVDNSFNYGLVISSTKIFGKTRTDQFTNFLAKEQKNEISGKDIDCGSVEKCIHFSQNQW